jgi:flagellar hook-associated protein 2
MGLQMSGLVNNLDTTSIVTQLMQVESNPQTLLKNRLAAVQADAAAYRAVNTRFSALQTAAQALTDPTTWNVTSAGSNQTSVVPSTDNTAVPGVLSFHVDRLATFHSQIGATQYASTSTAFGDTSISLTVGGVTSSIPVTGNGAGTGVPSLADAVAAINASGKGLSATTVLVAGKYQLQVSATTSGAAAAFSLTSAAGSFSDVTVGQDAQVTVGTGPGAYATTSASNIFTGLMAGTTFTVGQAGVDATVSVAKNPSAVASKVQSMVDAANSLLDSITAYTDPSKDTATLKGDSTLRDYANQILDAVSGWVNNDSLANYGVEVTKDGHLSFTSSTFTGQLTGNPTATQDMFTKTTMVNAGPDGIAGNFDDVTQPVGVAQQLMTLMKGATDTTTGSLVTLASSEDSQAKDLQSQIDDWDLRLAQIKDTYTAQFTAMTTALQTLQNQGSWLTGQINSLPSWNSSSKA